MEKRGSERLSTNINARFFYGNMFYTGNILNLSEKGMYISTRKCLPCDSMFVIIIRNEENLLKVVAKVKHLSKGNGHYNGMGIELLYTSVSYQNFVNSLKVAV